MKIELLYFGRPGEHLMLSRELVDVPDGVPTLAALLAWLRDQAGTLTRQPRVGA
jgi:sulfur-carrier protein